MSRVSRILALVVTVALVARTAHAEPVRLQPIPPGEDRIEPVEAGKAAPYTGHLFDAKTALRWGNYLEQCRYRLEHDAADERARGQLELGFWKWRMEQEREYQQKLLLTQHEQLRTQQTEIARLSQPVETPFYRSQWFSFTLGLAVAGGLFYLGAQAR